MNFKDDDREITAVYMAGISSRAIVGKEEVTKIEVFFENGQTENMPWFAIYVNDKIAAKYNGAYVDVVSYEDQED